MIKVEEIMKRSPCKAGQLKLVAFTDGKTITESQLYHDAGIGELAWLVNQICDKQAEVTRTLLKSCFFRIAAEPDYFSDSLCVAIQSVANDKAGKEEIEDLITALWDLELDFNNVPMTTLRLSKYLRLLMGILVTGESSMVRCSVLSDDLDSFRNILIGCIKSNLPHYARTE